MIYEATATGTVVCLMGQNRLYAIGDTAYQFKRQQYGKTLPPFAKGNPVSLIDGKWVPTQGKSIIRNWTDPVTVLS